MEFNDGTGYFYGEESIPEIWEEIPIVEEDIFQGYTEEEEPISIKKAVKKEGLKELTLSELDIEQSVFQGMAVSASGLIISLLVVGIISIMRKG